jgi:hypothetical protein
MKKSRIVVFLTSILTLEFANSAAYYKAKELTKYNATASKRTFSTTLSEE